MKSIGRTERQSLIRAVEEETDARLLVLVTGDRRGLETRIATDVFPFCLQHLTHMGVQDNIDLFLYSTGGITMAGFALVNLFREFCKKLRVIIPFKAHSCATLVALGADSIVMTRMGQLSPIDPSVLTPLVPQAPVPGMPGLSQPVPVNVEDVVSYLNMARKELAIKDEEMLTRIFERVSQNVHPLTLGAVYRAREQIGFLARTLLSRHMTNQEQISNIVELLTRGRFSHDYIVGYQEAKDVLKLPLQEVNDRLRDQILGLWREYDAWLQLSVPYHPEVFLGEQETTRASFDRAVVESYGITHVFRTVKEIRRVSIPTPQIQVAQTAYNERILSESWLLDNSV